MNVKEEWRRLKLIGQESKQNEKWSTGKMGKKGKVRKHEKGTGKQM